MVAGVNPGLAALAGEVADGFLVHPYHSPEYLEEILMPAIRRGVKSASRIESDLELLVNAFVVTNDEERKYVRQQIAFYASTPSYRAVMAHHGWAKVAQELSALAARQRWNDLPSLISDEVLQTFATVADEGELATVLRERYANLAHRLNLYIPFVPGQRDTFWRNLIAEISSE
jgi:alkanesulfonate monooxygenase SsuD/methylene tetrahydromethanopterin reductase-like flavin-dependent oxidoreductase (luciferase family)